MHCTTLSLSPIAATLRHNPPFPLRSPPREDNRRALCLAVPLRLERQSSYATGASSTFQASPIASSKQWHWRVLPKLRDTSPRRSSSGLIYAVLSTARTPDVFPPQHLAANNRQAPPPHRSPPADHTSPWSAFFRWEPPCPDSLDGCAALPSRPSATSLPASPPASQSQPGRRQRRRRPSVPPLFCDFGCQPICMWAGQWWPSEHSVVYLFSYGINSN
jgi:hypothetical protein